jgi:methionine sulfoxide reductase heme-binding subunit
MMAIVAARPVLPGSLGVHSWLSGGSEARLRLLPDAQGMSMLPNGITASTALWYASRATGVVALVLLTAVMVLGILVSRRGRLPGLPRFAGTSLHRSMSLLAAAFIAAHVGTAVADPFVSIRLAAAVVPFVSSYEPFWLGLGAIATDLMIALIVTSLLRARIPRRAWRGVHWLAYASWPVALAHSVGSSADLRYGWLFDLAIGCCLAVAGAVAWRAAGSARSLPRAARAARMLAATAGPDSHVSRYDHSGQEAEA